MILDEIASAKKKRIEEAKKIIAPEEMMNKALDMDAKTEFPFEKALNKEHISFICEIKKASPSKGIIDSVFDYKSIAKEYDLAGADAISVLTEEDYFKGSIEYLAKISTLTKIPLLRKDFCIDDYMIYEAKARGASCVLLICSLLHEAKMKTWIELCDKLGLSALVEAHDEEEVKMALSSGARIIGVNNRDLKTFKVDPLNCLRLRDKIPSDICFVAESGIKTRDDIVRLEENGVDAVLIGETFMRSEDKVNMLSTLRGRD